MQFVAHAHDPYCGCGQEYGFGEFSNRICQLLIVLCLYDGLIEVHPMIETATATDDPHEHEHEHETALRDITWDVDVPDGYDFREVQRRVIRDVTRHQPDLRSAAHGHGGWYLNPTRGSEDDAAPGCLSFPGQLRLDRAVWPRPW
ncbi:hypothetical protein ACH419_36770 [Streptomyces bobili]|uniref:hypothetical protein n=1 Tax=Streptomyces bobili TaxID=67280 RepID=UPI0037A24A70